jgi:tRNA (guanine-N7-)-methyltransferase
MSSLIFYPSSYFEPLNLANLYPNPQPLEVELGSGDGSFIVRYAQAHPEHHFLAVERLLGRLRKVDRKGQRAALQNLRCLRVEAGYLLEYLLPAHSVRALHIYFPDPWPKRKHRKNRLVNPHFTTLAEKVLEPSGTVYLRTDDPDYFAQIKTVFEAAAAFRPQETPVELSALLTDFESDFLARGIPCLRLAYQRV